MRLTLPIFRRLAENLRKRDWFGIGFELFVVVVGVLLGMTASRWAAERDEREFRTQMIAALEETLSDYVTAGPIIRSRVELALGEHQRRLAAGERPPPPYLRFPMLERAPTRAWDAIVATGVARSMDPKLVFKLAMHFTRADNWGERYQRYNAFTEARILPYLNDAAYFYTADGQLDPAYSAHIDRLDELLAFNDALSADAAALRRQLKGGE